MNKFLMFVLAGTLVSSAGFAMEDEGLKVPAHGTAVPKAVTQEQPKDDLTKQTPLIYGIDYVDGNDSQEVIERFLKLNDLVPYSPYSDTNYYNDYNGW